MTIEEAIKIIEEDYGDGEIDSEAGWKLLISEARLAQKYRQILEAYAGRREWNSDNIDFGEVARRALEEK